MTSPWYRWLVKLIDKEVAIHTTDKHGRRTNYGGRLSFVDKTTAVMVENKKFAIFRLEEIDEICGDEKYLQFKSKVKIKEIK